MSLLISAMWSWTHASWTIQTRTDDNAHAVGSLRTEAVPGGMKAELLRPTSAHVSRIEDLLLRRSKHASRVQRCLCKRLLQQKATRRIAIAGSDREKIQNKAKQAACTVLPTTALGCSCRCTKADFQLQSVRAHTLSLRLQRAMLRLRIHK